MQIKPAAEETSKKVLSIGFYAYRIMLRETEPKHIILNSRQLFHQFIVNVFATIESGSLLSIRLNQKKLRAEEYIHVKVAIRNDGNVQGLGKLVTLPATLTGNILQYVGIIVGRMYLLPSPVIQRGQK